MAGASNPLPNLNNANANSSRLIMGRLRSELAWKLILLFGLNLLVYAPYIFLQRHHFFPVTQMPVSFFDRWISFFGPAVWLYLSIYLLMPVGPFLMNRREQIFRYTAGIILISVLADAVFLFWPTTCPRPAVGETNAGYQTLTRLTMPFTPSLRCMRPLPFTRRPAADWFCANSAAGGFGGPASGSGRF
jgi:hypothetical protein